MNRYGHLSMVRGAGVGAARSHIYPWGHDAFWFALVNRAPDAGFYEG
jgi:hypothetical protein